MTKPFDINDFAKLFALTKGIEIMPLEEQEDKKNVISLRHDIDDEPQAAVEFARIENAHNIRATYFILDGAPYWADPHATLMAIEAILYNGHRIGWHNNAISRSIREKRGIPQIIDEALAFLRQTGSPVIGTASHGDSLCHEYNYTNYDIFSECRSSGKYGTWQLSDFGLEYEAYFLPRTHYISESGGIWRQDNEAVINDFKKKGGNLQILIHPQWWQLW